MGEYQRIWVGIDAGKGHHWAVAVDHEGRRLFSTKVANDQAAIDDTITRARELCDDVRWALDISSRTSALLIALLLDQEQPVVYIPGRTIKHMSGTFRGEGKTDAKDAHVIAETARLRPDFRPLEVAPEVMSELALLTSYRSDQMGQRVRMVNRLRDLLVGVCPALEREFEYKSRPGLVLLTRYQTPAALRRAGVRRITDWLIKNKVRSAAAMAERAAAAGQAQTISLPGEKRAAALVADLAQQVLDLDERVKRLDAEISDVLAEDRRAEIVQSLPGMGPQLTAEFIAVTGDLSGYKDANHLAAHGGISPVPHDSGRRSNNLKRPKLYNRRLCRVFYLSAQSAMIRPGASQDYYRKKRSEGMNHTQAVLCLARRRINVLWAMLRDMRPYTAGPSLTVVPAVAA